MAMEITDTSYMQDLSTARVCLQQGIESFMLAGASLRSAKEKHRNQHGMTGWEELVKGVVGISRVQADQMIAAYETFGESSMAVLSNFIPTSLKRLAGPSVPAEAREKALELAEAGERIDIQTANRLIEEAKAKATQETLAAVQAEMERADGRIRELDRQLFMVRQQGNQEETTETTALKQQLEEAQQDAEAWRIQLEQAQKALKERPVQEVEKPTDNPVLKAQMQVLEQREREQAEQILLLREQVDAYKTAEKRRQSETKADRERVASSQAAQNSRITFVEVMTQLLDFSEVGCRNIPNVFADISQFTEKDWQLLGDAIMMLKRYTLLLSQQVPQQEEAVVDAAAQ